MAEEVVDAEVVGHELVPQAQASATLFRTDDPVQVIEKASAVADALKNVLQKQGLTKNIQGRDHVLVEGWTTLGSMLGVVPVVEWTRPLDDGQGWEARVEARTLDGRVVGAAEAECTRGEKTWQSRDDYALRSMAQTRATSKALRGPLGFIVTLAGYDATPSEEIPAQPEDVPFRNTTISERRNDAATEKQVKYMKDLAKGLSAEQRRSACAVAAGVESFDEVPKAKVNDVLAAIKAAA